MNLRNKLEDLPSYLGINTFKPTNHPYEYFDSTYYYHIGHYHPVTGLSDLAALGHRDRSLLRYFNYLILIFYRKPLLFQSEYTLFKQFLQALREPSSKFHIRVGEFIYLKNNFSVPGLSAGWVGALPHLRLLCLLYVTSADDALKKLLVDSLFYKHLVHKDPTNKYQMINPITSLCDGVYRFHEYPNKVSGANSVINCNLLAYAFLLDLEILTVKDACRAFEKIFSGSLANVLNYSEDEANPITPAYHSLEHSIVLSSKLSSSHSVYLETVIKKLSSTITLKLLVKKVLFRLSRGYV